MFAFLEELMLQNMSLNRRYSMYRIIEIAFLFPGGGAHSGLRLNFPDSF